MMYLFTEQGQNISVTGMMYSKLKAPDICARIGAFPRFVVYFLEKLYHSRKFLIIQEAQNMRLNIFNIVLDLR